MTKFDYEILVENSDEEMTAHDTKERLFGRVQAMVMDMGYTLAGGVTMAIDTTGDKPVFYFAQALYRN